MTMNFDIRFPDGIFVEGADLSAASAPPTSAGDDDFFDSWDLELGL